MKRRRFIWVFSLQRTHEDVHLFLQIFSMRIYFELNEAVHDKRCLISYLLLSSFLSIKQSK
jgi:hypothetical protein